MNLHIVPDNIFINRFYDNLKELNLLEENRIIVRTPKPALKAVQRDLPFAPLYSSRFSSLVGNTLAYDKVYIHYFTPLLYRWVATHQFKVLNWMVWGADLYNLSSIDRICYEPITWKYVKRSLSLESILLRIKILTTQSVFRKKAYSKVNNILTWMHQEYQFAVNHLPIKAERVFFFYENQVPYDILNTIKPTNNPTEKLVLILGNSGSATNNHLDTIDFLERNGIEADLIIPVSYGEKDYIKFLKKKSAYSLGKLDFIDRYMPFEEYLKLLSSADGLVMNTIRPQGYGNIFMMLYMDKPVFFNPKNISLRDLSDLGIEWNSLPDIGNLHKTSLNNKKKIEGLFTHDLLLRTYQSLFG